MVDWGLEYLRGIFPPTGSEESSRAETPPEKPVVPAKTKSQAPPERIAGGPPTHAQQSHNDHPDARELLDSIVAYLRKYLVCDDHSGSSTPGPSATFAA